MYSRTLSLDSLLAHRSLFLFGPRQTGKSTLLRTRYPTAKYVDLLEADTFRQYATRPETLRQTLHPHDALVIIDEVQKLPSLLDEVHLLIERNKSLRFLLTGSSARKLKTGHVNLLAGRAWRCNLHPLVAQELTFSHLERRLQVGSLPAVVASPAPQEELRADVGTYLREEIAAERLTRSIERFSRFLEVAAMTNGEPINFTAVGSDSGVPPRTVREYYQILEDTLLGYLVLPYQSQGKRKPVATSKFYLFDVGVANTLLRRGAIEPGSELYGRALEHLIFLELRAYLDYNRIDQPLRYGRTHAKHEVNFIVGDTCAIEVKATSWVTSRDLKGLRALDEETRCEKKMRATCTASPIKTHTQRALAARFVENKHLNCQLTRNVSASFFGATLAAPGRTLPHRDAG